jgi:glycogen synthase
MRGKRILMVTSEATPFAKVGGLGEAVSFLCRALKKIGYDVRILIPFYGSLHNQKMHLESTLPPTGYPGR